VAVVHRIRQLDLKKTPSISETLDWTRALTLLNVKALDESVVAETLSTILKYEGDIRKAQAELKDFRGEAAREARGDSGAGRRAEQGRPPLGPSRWTSGWSSSPRCCARTASASPSPRAWTRSGRSAVTG
jgi:hypothetical protein